jgi:hypothetical protein
MKDNKKEKNKSYKVIVIDWVNGVLTKFQKIFPSLKDAKDYAETEDREVKIYDDEEKIIFLETKKDKKEKKEKKEKKDKDDDDDYN